MKELPQGIIKLPQIIVRPVPNVGFSVGVNGLEKKRVEELQEKVKDYLTKILEVPVKITGIEKRKKYYFFKVFAKENWPGVEEGIALVVKQFLRKKEGDGNCLYSR